MRYEGRVNYLEAKAKAGNVSAQADLDRMVQPENGLIWDAFAALSRKRPSGFGGPEPIQTRAVLDYFDLNGINDRRQRIRIASIIDKMDAAFLEWVRENSGDGG